MLGILIRAGYHIVNDAFTADIVVVNTCGFITVAKKEAIAAIHCVAARKRDGKHKLLVVTGCLAQRYERNLFERIPEIDLIIGVNQYPTLPRALLEALNGKRLSLCARNKQILTGERMLTTPPYLAYIRIAEGCDNRCAYCAIPMIRGGFRSRDMDDILEEIAQLAARGVKEHILVAQDSSRYGLDITGKLMLPDLLAKAADIPGVEWLRVLYCYPDEVGDELLEVMASKPNICKYLDLPLQHADPELLKRMNRRGDIAFIRKLLQKARDMGFILRTTMIVGFPGETEAQFTKLLSFVQEVRFNRLGSFCYSAEEDTPAGDMKGKVSQARSKKRMDRLMLAQQAISLELNRLRIGTVEKVLVEGIADDKQAVGRSFAEVPESDGFIQFPCCNDVTVGEFVNVRITGADIYDLMGVME